MLIALSEKSPEPIFQQIINQVKFMIASGEVKPGVQVPSIRELAVLLSVNPNTVAKAYKMLEVEGILEPKRGVGAFVSESLSMEYINQFKEEVMTYKVEELVRTAVMLSFTQEEIQKKIENAYKGGSDE